ncbi:unnamed protein product [Rotaria magnacalcarata]|uniref:Phospholipid/glycerol acyltransferase domain-containing protein n=1 Tax=Rotaria magnacalcarata TaxID=392030 RepID=A0A816EXV7_9BILA|nr:unnamed protein product [Rotaria magnacalcarata]CAF1652324.1 unnamed protein product [Rotaria magnacalcarata]CAF2119499.1 unnamed protein product [Rotaria magnacalcarata]CAF2260911.1 unnamed protein product [Rotaria magnacalcarata]
MLTVFLLTINSLRFGLPAVTLFGTAPTVITFWFLIRSVTYALFPPHIYRRCDDHLYSMYQRLILFFFQNWVNVKIYLHGDYAEIFRKKENVLYISNHQSSVDWIVSNMLAIHQGSLGHIRYVLKSDLKWIPLYGFYFQQHGCIYVRRNDKEDLDRVQKGMKQVEYNGLPVWLVIFPEGTRYNPVNNQYAIERSRLFAHDRGLSPFDHVLYPRSGATVAAIKALKHKLDAVYDITVMYNQTYDIDQKLRLAAPSMSEYLQGQTNELHVDIRRIEMNEIPSETDEQISNWLYQRFHLKDKLLKRFYDFQQYKKCETVVFNSDINDKPIEIELPLRETIYSCIFLTLTTLPFVLSERGRSFYWKIWLFGTPLGFLSMHLFPCSNFHPVTNN